MAVNIAARRGARNQQRKAALAQKRKAELEVTSLAGQVRQVAALPVQHCLLSQGLENFGMATLVLARGATPHSLSVAGFLIDTAYLGVKDAFFHQVSRAEFESLMDSVESSVPFAPIDPAQARKLLHDVVAWARTMGYEPHPDYRKVEPIFGTIEPAAGAPAVRFGGILRRYLANAAPAREALTYDADDIAA